MLISIHRPQLARTNERAFGAGGSTEAQRMGEEEKNENRRKLTRGKEKPKKKKPKKQILVTGHASFSLALVP
jgi:hypothetical protein